MSNLSGKYGLFAIPLLTGMREKFEFLGMSDMEEQPEEKQPTESEEDKVHIKDNQMRRKHEHHQR